MNKLSKLLYGEKMSHQSEDEYEAGKPIAIGCYIFFLFGIVSVIVFVVRMLGG